MRWVPGAAAPPRHLPAGCWRGDEHELLRTWYEWVGASPIPPREPADPEEAFLAQEAAEAAARRAREGAVAS